MDLLVQNQLSDDQWALIGCSAAFALCGAVLSLSHYIGKARQSSMSSISRGNSRTDIPASVAKTVAKSDRRAA